MRLQFYSIILGLIMTVSAAYAGCTPDSFDALEKKSDALCDQFEAADGPTHSASRPSEADAQELISCLQPYAADSHPKDVRAMADMEMSALMGYIAGDYKSGSAQRSMGKISWTLIKEADVLDDRNERVIDTLATAITKLRKYNSFDKMVIQAGLGTSLDKEKAQALDQFKALPELTPKGQKARDLLERS